MLTQKSILVLMALHFVADQILQLKTVQLVKSRNTGMLAAHVFTWGTFVLLFSSYAGYIMDSPALMFGYPLTMMAFHFVVEWILSRLYTYFKDNNQIRMMLLFFFLENFLILAAMIILWNYFFWLG